jgi:hypothetical protein
MAPSLLVAPGRPFVRRADRSSISSFHLADLGGKAIDIEVTQSLFPSLMLVDLE